MEGLPDCSAELRTADSVATRLYERARREQWDVERDVDWVGLTLEELAPSVRRAMAALYTQILYGEMVALHQSAKVVGSTPHSWVRSFALTQVVDEARHVEFFSRVVAKLDVDASVYERLRAFADDLDSADTVDEGLLGTQVILESFAQTVFIEGARAAQRARGRAVRMPGGEAATRLIEHLTERVGRDESRHVAFGVAYLRRRVEGLRGQALARLERRAEQWSAALDEVLAELAGPLGRLGLSSSEVRGRAEHVRRKHLATVFGSAAAAADLIEVGPAAPEGG